MDTADHRISLRDCGPTRRRQESLSSQLITSTAETHHKARLRAGSPVSRSQSRRPFEDGARCCDHPNRRAGRPGTVPGGCLGTRLGPFARHDVRAGSADRADSSGGVRPLLGLSEEFLVEHVHPRLMVVRSGGKRSIVLKRASRTASGNSPALQLVPDAARIGVIGRSAQPISPELRLGFSFRGAGGFWHA